MHKHTFSIPLSIIFLAVYFWLTEDEGEQDEESEEGPEGGGWRHGGRETGGRLRWWWVMAARLVGVTGCLASPQPSDGENKTCWLCLLILSFIISFIYVFNKLAS